MMKIRNVRKLGPAVALLALSFFGCDSEGSHDSGIGAGKPVPATQNCTDLCARLAECTVALCNEDTSSTRYTPTEPSIASSCRATCTEAAAQSQITAQQWTCTFQSSCRAFLDADACKGMGHYSCS